MIALLIRWSLESRFLVLLATVFVLAWGVWALQRTPVDALPDLSDVQVIIRTQYPGQAPRALRWVLTQRAWAGSMNTRSSIAQVGTTFRSCVRFRTGS